MLLLLRLIPVPVMRDPLFSCRGIATILKPESLIIVSSVVEYFLQTTMDPMTENDSVGLRQ